MATFYRCINNGVVALMPEKVMFETRTWGRFVHAMPDDTPSEFIPPRPRPIFTFCDQQRIDAGYGEFHTGSYDLMDRLLAGHGVLDGGFYVPFSNHTELEDGPLGETERKFRTTLAEAVEAFELIRKPPEDSLKRARDRLRTAGTGNPACPG